MVNRDDEIERQEKKTNEILTVYLRNRKVYKHSAWIREFGGPEVLAIGGGTQTY